MTSQDKTSPEQGRIRIALASDLRLVRAAFQEALDRQPRLHVVWSGGSSALELPAAVDSRPDVLFLDPRAPEHEGIEHVDVWRAAFPEVPLLLVRQRARIESLPALFEHGVRGVVAREDEPEVMRLAVEALAAGRDFVSQSLRGSGAVLSELPSGEQDLLRHLALGRSFEELASGVDRSVRELREEAQELMRSTGCATRDDLLRLAIRHELLPWSEPDS